jgi:Ca-activated chloride channel family protein
MGLKERAAIGGARGARAFLACGTAGILVAAVVCVGQEIPGTASPHVFHSDTKFQARSELVVIPVTVTDGAGKVISGLEKEHFALFENKTQQTITHFAAEDAPASIGVVFDTSDSMEPRMGNARAAVNALLAAAHPDDEFLLVRFSTEARLVVPLTSRVEDIRNRVAAFRVGGTTALLDGVRLAMEEMKNARYTRKAIVIVSDGEDNSSHWTMGQLKAAVRERDIVIYAIGITDSDEAYSPYRRRGGESLNEIASESGGRLFEVTRQKQLPEIATKIGGWLRNQYVLGYVPSTDRDGSYRKVQLRVTRPKGYPKLHAVWRQGYYAPKE